MLFYGLIAKYYSIAKFSPQMVATICNSQITNGTSKSFMKNGVIK